MMTEAVAAAAVYPPFLSSLHHRRFVNGRKAKDATPPFNDRRRRVRQNTRADCGAAILTSSNFGFLAFQLLSLKPSPNERYT